MALASAATANVSTTVGTRRVADPRHPPRGRQRHEELVADSGGTVGPCAKRQRHLNRRATAIFGHERDRVIVLARDREKAVEACDCAGLRAYRDPRNLGEASRSPKKTTSFASSLTTATRPLSGNDTRVALSERENVAGVVTLRTSEPVRVAPPSSRAVSTTV